MKTSLKYSYRILFLILSFGLLSAGPADAQLLTNLHDFTGPDGSHPQSGLLLIGGTFYGTTTDGGDYSQGTIFAIGTNGNGFITLHNFSSNNLVAGSANSTLDGAGASGAPINIENVLYGTTIAGGVGGQGTIYRMNLDGTGFTNLHSFATGNYDGADYNSLTNADGASPFAGLKSAGGKLYGTTEYGGTNGSGTVFSINFDGTGFTNLHIFSHFTPPSIFLQGGINSDGGMVFSDVTVSNGVIYGTTYAGGSEGIGTIFRLNTDGSGFTSLYAFTNFDQGGYPLAGLTLDGDTLYGAAKGFPDASYGTLFKIKTNGSGFSIIYTFGITTTLAYPYAPMLLKNNIIYGSANGGNGRLGTDYSQGGGVFSIHTDGSGYQVQYRFSDNDQASDGANPYGLLLFTNGGLYGQVNGPLAGGIFKVTVHPSFFNNEASVNESNSIYYLAFSNSIFGYYEYQSYPYLYHFDLGFEYFLDASDGHNGAYLYDFASGHFWYTNPQDFPYLYDFTLNSWLYYFPDPQNAGHYTSNPRYFYNFSTGKNFTQ